MRIAFLIAAMLGGSPLAVSATESQSPDATAIKAAAKRWADAYNRGDISAIAGLYTADAKLLPEGSAAIVGRAEIREYFERTRGSQPPQSIRFYNFELYGHDPVVTECSEVQILDQNGKVTFHGKQVLIRIKQDGEWKIHRDIWTRSDSAGGG